MYHIDEGKRWRVGNIYVHIAGDNPHTKIQTALNRLSFRSGEIADIREIRASERRLQASGLFMSDPVHGVMPKITYHIPEVGKTEMAKGERRLPRPKSRRQGAGTDRTPAGARSTRRCTEHNSASRPATHRAAAIIRRAGSTAAANHLQGRNAAPTSFRAKNNSTYTCTLRTPKLLLPRKQSLSSIGVEEPSRYEVRRPPYDDATRRTTNMRPHPRPIMLRLIQQLRPRRIRRMLRRQPTTRVPISGSLSGHKALTSRQPQPANTPIQPTAARPSAEQAPTQQPSAAIRTLSTRPRSPQPQLPPSRPDSCIRPAADDCSAACRNFAGAARRAAICASTSRPAPAFGPPRTSGPLGPDPRIMPVPPVPTSTYPNDPFTPMLTDPAVDMDVVLSEAQTGRLMLGVAVNSDAGLVGQILLDEQSFDIARYPTSWDDFVSGKAWRGGGQRFRIEAAPGTEVQRYLISFSEPYLFDSPYSLGLSGSFFTRKYRDWDEQRVGGRVSLGYQWVENDLSTGIAYRGEDVEISNPSNPALPQLAEVLGHNAVHGFKWTVANDTRDSAFLATEGHFLQMELEQVVGSFQYPRAIFDARQYMLLNERPDHSGRHVLTLATKFGFTGNDTPIYDTFYAGGFSSLRGFDFRGASPVVQNVQVGGEFEFLNTVEYLFPLTADDMIHGVAFSISARSTKTSRSTISAWLPAWACESPSRRWARPRSRSTSPSRSPKPTPTTRKSSASASACRR